MADNYRNAVAQAQLALPAPLRRALGTAGVKVVQASPYRTRSASYGNHPAIATVDADSPDTVEVTDPQRFTQYPDQTLAHESTHLLMNNLAPGTKQLPANNPNDPYDYGGADRLHQLRQQGVKLYNLPQEEAATVVQYYQSQGGKNAPQHIQNAYGPWVEDIDHAPLSTIQPTKPGQEGIETTPRAPVAEPETYRMSKTFEAGESPEGEIDISAGLVPHPPMHSLGRVTAYDHDTGLPIVKRSATEHAESAKPDPKPQAKPDPKPEADPKPKSKPADVAKPSKGAMVTLQSGGTGKIAFYDPKSGIARVKTADGRNLSMRKGAFELASDESKSSSQSAVEVQAHTRHAPGSSDLVPVQAHTRSAPGQASLTTQR